MLKAENVSFRYREGNAVLENVSFTAGAGLLTVLAGRNGAGKSTLMRLSNGLLKPTAGCVFVDGVDTRTTSPAKLARVVGTVFQSPEQQIFNATVHDEVAFGPKHFGLSEAEVERQTSEALMRCGLEAYSAQHPLDLDRTGRMFVALASALATKPKLLLLDETQRGMDARSIRGLEAILREEKCAGTAIVFVCHDMEFVARNADQVLVLHEGMLHTCGAPREFFTLTDFLQRAGLAPTAGQRLAQGLGLPLSLSAKEFVRNWEQLRKQA